MLDIELLFSIIVLIGVILILVLVMRMAFPQLFGGDDDNGEEKNYYKDNYNGLKSNIKKYLNFDKFCNNVDILTPDEFDKRGFNNDNKSKWKKETDAYKYYQKVWMYQEDLKAIEKIIKELTTDTADMYNLLFHSLLVYLLKDKSINKTQLSTIIQVNKENMVVIQKLESGSLSGLYNIYYNTNQIDKSIIQNQDIKIITITDINLEYDKQVIDDIIEAQKSGNLDAIIMQKNSFIICFKIELINEDNEENDYTVKLRNIKKFEKYQWVENGIEVEVCNNETNIYRHLFVGFVDEKVVPMNLRVGIEEVEEAKQQTFQGKDTNDDDISRFQISNSNNKINLLSEDVNEISNNNFSDKELNSINLNVGSSSTFSSEHFDSFKENFNNNSNKTLNSDDLNNDIDSTFSSVHSNSFINSQGPEYTYNYDLLNPKSVSVGKILSIP